MVAAFTHAPTVSTSSTTPDPALPTTTTAPHIPGVFENLLATVTQIFNGLVNAITSLLQAK